MNLPLRPIAIILGLCAAWAFGYMVGGRGAGAAKARPSSASTPLPEAGEAQGGALTSTAIGRLIDGKNDFQRVRTLYEYSLSLGADAMAGAVNEAMQLPLTHRNMALGVLFARWAELDPEAAVKYAQLLPKSANAGFLRRTALTAWAGQDFDAALAWALSLGKGDARNDSLATIAGQLAKRDPNGALKLIAENFTGRDAANAYDDVFSTWAETDFPAAYAAARGIADPGTRIRAMRAALNQRVESDPRGVLEALREAKLSELRWDIGNRALSRWAERDLAAAREYALALPAGEMRDLGLQAVAREMGQRDPHAALDWLRELPGTEGSDEAVRALFGMWAGSDAKAAIEAARGLPEERLRDIALAHLAQTLVDADVSTALGLLQELPAGHAADRAYQHVAWRWGRTDPKAAAEWFSNHAGDGNRWSLNQIVQEWARNDPGEALQWASALPDSHEQKGGIVGQVLGNLARGNPAEAVEQFSKLTAEQQAAAALSLTSNWAWRDPAAAAQWVMGLKDEAVRGNAVGGVAFNWASRDPAGAARWLETLSAGSTRDSAVHGFALSAATKDPEGALAWALTIGDAGKRDGALQGVVSSWARKDREAAAQWVRTTHAIPDEARKRLEPVLKQPRGPGPPPQLFVR